MSDRMPLMKCGHRAQGYMSKTYRGVTTPKIPACMICAGLSEEQPDPATVVVPEPDMTGRMARCAYYGSRTYKNECDICKKQPDQVCHCEQLSTDDLAFFEYKPDKPYDEFYCGCHSWD